MLKSSSFSRISQKKAADLQLRKRIANQPTPGEMLELLKGLKRGQVLVLVNKTGLPEDTYVDDVGRDFTDVLFTGRPQGAARFRRLMERMLSDLKDVPAEGGQAARSLSEWLADEYTRSHGVVYTQTLFNQLAVLNDALERNRKARQDLEGEPLLEQDHSARESPPSNDGLDAVPATVLAVQSDATPHAASDTVTDLVAAGIGGPPRLARTTRATVSLRHMRVTPPVTLKDDASE